MLPTHSILCMLVWTAVFQEHWITGYSSGLVEGQYIQTYRKEACSRIGNVPDSQNTALVIVDTRITTIELPRGLSPGSYRCQWKLILNRSTEIGNEASSKQVKGIRIDFHTRLYWPDDGGYDSIIGNVTVAIPSLQFVNARFGFSRYATPKNVKSFNNSFITLEIDIKRPDYSQTGVFFMKVSKDSTIPNLPQRFRVKDIIGKSQFIKNHRFKWMQARGFCRSKDLDLCRRHKEHVCSYNQHSFSHADVEISTQYIPVLPFNTWVEVTDNGNEACDDGASGPPLWGIFGDRCPLEGCKSKSYIYCCDYDSDFKLRKYEPHNVHLSTARDWNGTVYYRFSEEKSKPADAFDYDYYPGYERWYDFWKPARRSVGDITKFTSSRSYSGRTPSPLYVCQKSLDFDEYSDVEKYRYMLDLKPCRHPWKYQYHVYVSTKAKKGLRALYVGQSPQGHGSRVSTTPPCCGYTDPASDFVMYAQAKDGWIQHRKPDVCNQILFSDATFNATSVSSKSLEGKGRPPIYCRWKIDANPEHGKGVTIKYAYRGGNHRCRYNYLRMVNPITGRIFSEASACHESGSFTTDGSSLEIILSVEEDAYSFSITYSASEKTLPVPKGFEVSGENRTWTYARNLCRGKSLELCTLQQICPSVLYPYGGIRDSWIAVADRFNEWTETSSSNGCNLVSLYEGPPIWSEEKDPKRDIVYCCDGPKVHFPKSETVRINVGYNSKKGGVYWFGKKDEWNSPAYRYNYNDPYHSDVFGEMYPWKPPSRIDDFMSGTVDYFEMSSQYTEGIFDLTVYFCSTSTSWSDNTAFDYYYKASLKQCRSPWQYAFHLYGGRTKSTNASVSLAFGKSGGLQKPSCCRNNPDSFTIHVIDAGRLESYTEPVVSDYYY